MDQVWAGPVGYIFFPTNDMVSGGIIYRISFNAITEVCSQRAHAV